MLDPIHNNTTCVVKPGLSVRTEKQNFSRQDNLFLLTELVIKIGLPKKLLKQTSRALALRQSE